MGFLKTIASFAWPTISGSSMMRGDYFSDGSKFRKGIHGSGIARVFDNNTRKINARNAYEESKIGRAIIRRKVDTVVETGIRFRSSPLYEMLPVSKAKADEFARQLTLRFHLFCLSKHFCSNATMNGYQFQRHLALQQYRDGEYFVLFNRKYVNQKKQLSRLSFQAIDPLQIKGTGGITNLNGYNDMDVDKGIIRGEYSEEVAYNIKVKSIADDGRQVTKDLQIPAFTKNGLTRMVHGFVPEYTNQLRGNGDLFPFIQELQQFLDLDLSHVNKAINQSNMVLASETDGDENSVNPFAGLGIGQSGMASDIDIDSLTDTDPVTTIGSSGAEIKYREMDEAQIMTPGSTALYDMPKGQKIKMLNNTAPVDGYSDFVDGSASMLTAAADMPLEFLKMKFGSSYNANRATIQFAYRMANVFRSELISDFLEPTLEAFAEIEIASGRLSAPGFSDPIVRKAYLNGQWIGAAMPEMDALKQNKANKIALEIGSTTPDRISIERDGSDGAINRMENTTQLDELTVPYWQQDQSDTDVSDKEGDE